MSAANTLVIAGIIGAVVVGGLWFTNNLCSRNPNAMMPVSPEMCYSAGLLEQGRSLLGPYQEGIIAAIGAPSRARVDAPNPLGRISLTDIQNQLIKGGVPLVGAAPRSGKIADWLGSSTTKAPRAGSLPNFNPTLPKITVPTATKPASSVLQNCYKVFSKTACDAQYAGATSSDTYTTPNFYVKLG